MSQTVSLLNRFIEPLVECFTPDVAQRIVDVKTDAATMERLEELRTKANHGTLTDAERAEYQEFVDAYDFVSLLKLKARAVLARKSP